MNKQPEIKRLGAYLIEAGLITPAQVDVALNDQEFMADEMRFGDVLVARGWIKQQTLDYLMEKIVEPEQLIARRVVLEDAMLVRHAVHPEALLPDVVLEPTTVIEPEPAPQPEPVAAAPRKSVLGQARSLDGEAIFQVVMPTIHQTETTDTSDPSLMNERKPLTAKESEDGLNWVG
jgi:hypothetical protein